MRMFWVLVITLILIGCSGNDSAEDERAAIYDSNLKGSALRALFNELKPDDYIYSFGVIDRVIAFIQDDEGVVSDSELEEIISFVYNGDMDLLRLFVSKLSSVAIQDQILDSVKDDLFKGKPGRFVLLKKMALSSQSKSSQDFINRAIGLITDSEIKEVREYVFAMTGGLESDKGNKLTNISHRKIHASIILHHELQVLRTYIILYGGVVRDPLLFELVLKGLPDLHESKPRNSKIIIEELFTADVIKAWEASFGKKPSESLHNEDLKKLLVIQESR